MTRTTCPTRFNLLSRLSQALVLVCLLGGLLISPLGVTPGWSAQPASPSAVIQEVNALRAANGLPAYKVNSALMAAEPFGKRLLVMDSRQVSMGLGFEVLEAVDLFTQLEQEHPQADLSDLIPAKLAELKQTLSRLRVVALLDTMEYLRRSGRVSWAQAALGGLLDVKLIVGVQDGKVNRLAQARKRRNGIERVLEQVHSMGKLKRLGIMHTGVEGDEIRQMLDEFSPQLETRPQSTQPALPLIDWITPVVGAHIGTNALAIAALAWDEFSS